MRKMWLTAVGILIIFLMGCNFGGEEQNVHAEVMPTKMDAKAIVTIVSDDGFYDTAINLNELADKHELKVTVAGVVEIVDQYYKEWLEIEEQGNVELISHSYSHLKMSEENNYSEDELRHQISDSINYYKENFKTDQIAFICPENTMCQLGYRILEENNVFAIRQGTRGWNYLQPQSGRNASNWHNLYTFGVGDVETTEWRNLLVDKAVEDNTWLIEMWHNVYKEGQEIGYQGISYEMADEHMEYIASKSKEGEIWVASLVDATKYLYEKKYASVEAALKGNILKVDLKVDTEKLPMDIFDYPLTIKIQFPNNWDEKKLNVNNEDTNIFIVEENSVKYMVFEMIPNSNTLIIENN